MNLSFDNINEAILAIVQFERDKFDTLPPHVQAELNRLNGLGISPAERIVHTAQALYSNREALTRKADRELVAALFDFAAEVGRTWYGLAINGLGERLSRTLRVENDEEGMTISAEDIPPAFDQFKPPAPLTPITPE
ncbi:MAG: hypothetical protein H0U52_00670 [Chloroflexi bacterium]|nr:hypothetical protein [Chloroflexota bacterium]